MFRKDGIYSLIKTTPDIAAEIEDRFKFRAPNYQFHPKFKMGVWDGYISIFSRFKRLLYNGLIGYLQEFAKSRQYTISYENERPKLEISDDQINSFLQSLNLPFEARDYQRDTFAHCVRNGTHLFVSPTASGKSLMIYSLIRFFDTKTLLIVPRTQLVNQMYTDFIKYGFNAEKHCHRIYAGQEKETDKKIVISTWQSLQNLPNEYFHQFKMVIGDEAHKAKANELKRILESTINCNIRFGFTGSLDHSKTNKTVLEGLFGPYQKLVSTSELINRKFLADLSVDCLVLKHPSEVRKLLSKTKYDQEIDWLISNESRNKFVRNLALSCKGNTLLLFRRVEHGKLLHDMIQEKATTQKICLIHGEIKQDEREAIRQIMNDPNGDSITVASLGTTAEGIDAPNINTVIICHPTKSRIEVMQLIGRGLRRSETKTSMKLIDIADDLRTGKNKLGKPNHTLRHYLERLKYYAEENFKWKQYNIEVNG